MENMLIPKVIKSKQLSNLLEKILVERRENLEILHKNLNSFGPVLPDRKRKKITLTDITRIDKHIGTFIKCSDTWATENQPT